GTVDNLITPAINCLAHSDIELSFDTYFEEFEDEYVHVQLSINGRETWLNLITFDSTSGSYPHTLDISEWADGEENVSIRFRYDDSLEVWGYFWGVDNVSLTGTLSTGTLNGTITDRFIGIPIWNATVDVFRDEVEIATANTNEEGFYSISDLGVYSYTVVYEADGYICDTETDVEIIQNDTTTLDMELELGIVIQFSGILYSADTENTRIPNAIIEVIELGLVDTTNLLGGFNFGNQLEDIYHITVTLDQWNGVYHNPQFLNEVSIDQEHLPVELFLHEILPPDSFALTPDPVAAKLTWSEPGNRQLDYQVEGPEIAGYRIIIDNEYQDTLITGTDFEFEISDFVDHSFSIAAEYSYGFESLVWSETLTGTGGPGYTLSEEPFIWIEIRTNDIGTALQLGDEDYSDRISMGDILFEHFGIYYDEFTVSSNGGISMLNHFLSSETEQIPAISHPNAFIAPLWTDLDPSNNQDYGAWYFVDDVQQLIIIQYYSPPFEQNGVYSFETILNPNENSVTFSYLSASGIPWPLEAVIGMENSNGTHGIQLLSEEYLNDSTSIKMTWQQLYGGIDGTVWAEEQGGETLSGVSVWLDGSHISDTQVHGTYQFSPVGAGTHSIRFRLANYETSDIIEAIITENEVTRINAVLNRISGRDENDNLIPGRFALYQNYPNPFNSNTLISFDVPNEERVTLTVYNLLGETVITLEDDLVQAGTHQVEFDASSLAGGIYICKIKAGNFSKAQKMVFLK
ncbi:MAG: carboxypeptidase regulatory-like domain-containing protein, partial [Candidatus Electryonea clarkiae]|nr:carboxypeptidase regulatory-like domain-containing protein [Candidatus Electryonea clarkiae]